MDFSTKEIKPKKSQKVIKSIIGLSIALDLIFFIARAILLNYGILFRNVVLTSVYLNNTILVIAIIINLNISIGKRSKKVVSVTSFISIIILPIILFYMFFIYVFTIDEESVCYQEGKKVVAVSAGGLRHHSFVVFYEPINFAMMKSASLDGFSFDGSRDYYKYRNNGENLKNEKINVRSSYYFEELSTLDAKKKFSTNTFKYLGNHTYDFGNIQIKFDDRESYVEEAIITRNVASYGIEGINIIGENIKNVEENIIKVNNEYNEEYNSNTTISFEERMIDGEKNILVFNISDYGTNLNKFTFVVDSNDIVTKIKFTNY